MLQHQRIFPVRRSYNRFVADQTLEDFSLRYTAEAARRFSPARVANTAMGAISFLACEALGGAVTLHYGFVNAMAAIAFVSLLIFLVSLPIAHYAAKFGVDMDLLTRGAGFGYLGSTVTSLIYASFTFILFAIEGTIMADALRMCFGLPIGLSYAVSALAILPIAALGMRFISSFQFVTQPVWIAMQLAPLAYVLLHGSTELGAWASYPGAQGAGGFDLRLFGFSTSIFLSLLPQIGEQVDYLRFMPARESIGANKWRLAIYAAGPGWIVIGTLKLAAGSFLAYEAASLGVPAERASQPSEIYYLTFNDLFGSPAAALALTGIFVVVCQTKINITNAYAGSIAWSNFFSRITRNHPGRVVWLVFNVMLALMLMEFGVSRLIDGVLAFYSNFAVAWIGALAADLVINKPLKLSPATIEFRRAYLYDVNPVGLGSMAASLLVSSAALSGMFGETAQALAALIGLAVAFVAAPLIAYATRGRYYIARSAMRATKDAKAACLICENVFESSDIADCPAYGGSICSLCCSLDMRCHDVCKKSSRLVDQIAGFFDAVLPDFAIRFFSTRAGRFLLVLALLVLASAALLAIVYLQFGANAFPEERAVIRATLEVVFVGLTLVMGVAAWTLVLAQESRRIAEEETRRQTETLRAEIEAHERTDAELQKAKEVAESANVAKTRFIAGINHEIRTPLNAISGYAQLLERQSAENPRDAIRVIRRSTEHITNLIDSLLDVSKIESGAIDISRETFRIDEALDQLVDMFRLQAAAKGLDFRYSRSPNLPLNVRTDKKRLRQILINILSNAVKFTERGHVSLNVRYRSDIAEFEIADTGVGIPQDDIERVFAPFERGNTPGVAAIPGTGLGLTITKLLTHVIGGEIRVESAPGKGSRFVVRLHLAEVAPVEPDAAAPRVRGYLGARRSILVADDSAEHVDIMRQMLDQLGFTVLTAANGEDCIRIAHERCPDLVMLDIMMPKIDGWTAARELRERFPELAIVMASANAHELIERRGQNAPHDDFLVKPFEMNELIERVGNLLEIEWVYTAAPRPAPPRSDTVRLESRHLDELARLAAIGHSRGLEKAFARIEAERPELKAALAPLRDKTKNFAFDALRVTLDELKKNAR